MDEQPDTLTVALDDYLVAHCALLQAIAGESAAYADLIKDADTKWRTFVERLNERSTNMAASAALGVIRKYTEALSAIETRVTDLETHDAQATAAGIDDTPARLEMIATYMQKVTEMLPVLIQRDKDRALHMARNTEQQTDRMELLEGRVRALEGRPTGD